MRRIGIAALVGITLSASARLPAFSVIAFFTGKEDPAHISFLREAEQWFPQLAAKYNFRFDTTSNWTNLTPEFLARYDVVVFLDTRPEDPAQRSAFQAYMEHGGAWMGFHFAGFALTPSAYPADWDWYHNTFLGAGSYVSNTWRPTAAVLRVEDRANRPRAACRPRSRLRRMSGIAGKRICEKTPTSISCCPSTRAASPSARDPSRTRFGTAATIPSFGPTGISR